ncbi:hypothetical protein J6590_102053, partial [Homalodisca vitripennis]
MRQTPGMRGDPRDTFSGPALPSITMSILCDCTAHLYVRHNEKDSRIESSTQGHILWTCPTLYH